MTFSVIRIKNFFDNVLRPEYEETYTPESFCEMLRVNGHDRRGPALADKKGEIPWKNGIKSDRLTALVPVTVDWAKPQSSKTVMVPCQANHPQAQWRPNGEKYVRPVPFNELNASRPTWRHRGKETVSGSGPIICLDIDDMTPTIYEALKQVVLGYGWRVVMFSTHSQGHGEDVKARLIAFADRAQTADEIEIVREALARKLTEELKQICPTDVAEMLARMQAKAKRRLSGTIADDACFGRHMLFFLPSCPDDDTRAAAAFMWFSSDYGATGSIAIDTLPMGLSVRKAEKARRIREYRVKHGLIGADTLAEVTRAHKAAATELVYTLAETIRTHPTVSNMGALLNYGRVSDIGSYSMAGCIDRDTVMAILTLAVIDHGKRLGVAEDKVKSRFYELDEGFAKGWNAGPKIPDVAEDKEAIEEIEEELDTLGRREALEEQLERQVPDKEYTNLQATEEIKRVLRTYEGGTLIIDVTPGAGKTHAAIVWVAERSEAGLETLIMSLEHDLLYQTAQSIRKLCKATHQHSALRQVGNDPICESPAFKEIKEMVDTYGVSHKSICIRCPLKTTCAAFKFKPEDSNVLLAPFAGYHPARKAKPAAVLLLDEMPSIAEPVTLTKVNLQLLADTNTNSLFYMLVSSRQAEAIAAVAKAILTGKQPFEGAVDTLKEKQGQIDASDLEPDISSYRNNHEGLLLVRAFLRVVAASEDLPVLGKHGIEAMVFTPEYLEASRNAVVLTATPILAGFPNAQLSRFSVMDGCAGIAREIHYRSRATRTAILGKKSSHINWPLVERDIAHMLQRTQGSGRILLITYKLLADALRGEKAGLLAGRDVEIAHYGAVRGKNHWQEGQPLECGAFVTMYDERAAIRPMLQALALANGIPESEWRNWVSEQWREIAAGELAQAHGRARDPRRSRACLHLHYGAVAPLGWHSNNAIVIDTKTGRGTEARDVAAVEALVSHFGSVVATAKALGVGHSTVSRWRSGAKPVPEKFLSTFISLRAKPLFGEL